MSRIVVALGGNALIRRGQIGSTEVQRRNVARAAAALVALEQAGHQVVLTHGNGPQVGYLSIEADAAQAIVPAPPLDVLVAESQGQIGYLVAQALAARFAEIGRDRSIAALVCQTVVDPADPAFGAPTKPIGPVYDRATADRLASEHGWSVARDGRGWRRVVASPQPLWIVEADAVRALVDAGVLVIAGGGGGIPVTWQPGRGPEGAAAVVDKDLLAVVLAEVVQADALLLLTDVKGVYPHGDVVDTIFGVPLSTLSLDDADRGVADGSFASGSMGPKVRAAADFVRRTGRFAAIGALEDAVGMLEGRSGTRLVVEALVSA